MKQLEPGTVEASAEMHIPVVKVEGDTVTVARVELYIDGIPVDVTPLIEKGIQVKE